MTANEQARILWTAGRNGVKVTAARVENRHGVIVFGSGGQPIVRSAGAAEAIMIIWSICRNVWEFDKSIKGPPREFRSDKAMVGKLGLDVGAPSRS